MARFPEDYKDLIIENVFAQLKCSALQINWKCINLPEQKFEQQSVWKLYRKVNFVRSYLFIRLMVMIC